MGLPGCIKTRAINFLNGVALEFTLPYIRKTKI